MFVSFRENKPRAGPPAANLLFFEKIYFFFAGKSKSERGLIIKICNGKITQANYIHANQNIATNWLAL
jgi:hypothetical protein